MDFSVDNICRFSLNCGKTLRDSTTKLLQGCNNGEVSDQGMVKSLNIGQPDATKTVEHSKAHRLFLKKKRTCKLLANAMGRHRKVKI